MTDARMMIIVPTRSRPENVAKVVRAWEETDAFRHASLLFGTDADDPRSYDYACQISLHRKLGFDLEWVTIPIWQPLVPKLNYLTHRATQSGPPHFAIGFAGDDHLPRTPVWAARYLEKLIEMGTGVVSCPDGYRADQLPTQWAMTADIVRTLGRMVPAPVDHLYCDNAVWDLAKAANCYAYLDDVLIEHMHPVAGKASNDQQYRRVNSSGQYVKDRESYQRWLNGDGLLATDTLTSDAFKVRKLLTSGR